jgi:acetyl esterase/lipase
MFPFLTVRIYFLLMRRLDLTRSCDSWDSNSAFDIVPIPSNGDHLDPVACYLGSNMELYLTHPYASPLFGDFTGLPPLLIQAGESEVLRDEITLLAHKATLAGVQVMHELYEDAVSGKSRRTTRPALLMSVLSCRFMCFKLFLSSRHHNMRFPHAAPL